jgi:hypothetical protein
MPSMMEITRWRLSAKSTLESASVNPVAGFKQPMLLR